MIQYTIPYNKIPRVVIIGGGFGGIQLAKHLSPKEFQVVLIDKHNYHTFQPLLYQVATGGLEPGSIAYPLRRIFKRRSNFHFRVGEVEQVDHANQQVVTTIGRIYYDYLVIATGSTNNFFNLAPAADQFMPLKTVPEALNLRSILLQNMEKALLTTDKHLQSALMNVVIVGAGPTGVELAGAIAEMRKFVLPKDYPELDLSKMDIYLFEMADRVLPTMTEKSSKMALGYLKEFDVNVRTSTKVTDYTGKEVMLEDGSKVPSETFVWTAGVKGAPVQGLRGDALVKGDRLAVDEFCRVKDYENVFAIGDVAQFTSEDYPNGLPMLAQVAIQQGRHLGKNISSLVRSKPMQPFEFHNKGTMATIGRNRAVVDLRYKTFGGFGAWFVWMFVHIMQLIGFRNKVVVFLDWIWNYLTYDRALRLIIRPYVRPAREKHMELDPVVEADDEQATV